MKPQPVNDANLAFGGNMAVLLPSWSEIPEEFKDNNNKWVKVFSHWFFEGLGKGTKFDVKEGIDGNAALRHLAAVMCSFEPKHEHKEAGCAYLMSQWFNDIIPAKKVSA